VPGAWCEAQGERLKILYAEPVSGSGTPGEIINDQLTVACGEGALRLTRLQRPGKSAMEARELLRGFSLPRGTCLG
jgi:methionyl-tRNA formyltransferase